LCAALACGFAGFREQICALKSHGEDRIGSDGCAGGVVLAARLSEHRAPGVGDDEQELQALKAAARQRIAVGSWHWGGCHTLRVSLVVRDLTVDCLDSPGLARFWGAVLERPVEGAGEGFWVSLPDGNQPSMIFFREVADAKQVKNRLHLDLNPGDGTLAAELKRLTALGATVMARHNRGSCLGWVVLADPEGNEFCMQSSDAEVAAVEEHLDAEDDAR
jgi:hypothetical protein